MVPGNHQRTFAKKSEIKMDGILGTHRRMLIEHDDFRLLRMSTTT
jgi:hypothetical protein